MNKEELQFCLDVTVQEIEKLSKELNRITGTSISVSFCADAIRPKVYLFLNNCFMENHLATIKGGILITNPEFRLNLDADEIDIVSKICFFQKLYEKNYYSLN